MDPNTEENLKVEEEIINKAAEVFYKIFYDSLDSKRMTLSKLYMDNAKLVWNGNCIIGPKEILQLYENLPASKHTILSMDVQSISKEVTQGQNSMMVNTTGQVAYDDNLPKLFTQNFLLTTVGTSWKVVDDIFRFIE